MGQSVTFRNQTFESGFRKGIEVGHNAEDMSNVWMKGLSHYVPIFNEWAEGIQMLVVFIIST